MRCDTRFKAYGPELVGLATIVTGGGIRHVLNFVAPFFHIERLDGQLGFCRFFRHVGDQTVVEFLGWIVTDFLQRLG